MAEVSQKEDVTRDSAEAAALTVGEQYVPATKKKASARTRIGITALAVVSVVLIATGAFALAGGSSQVDASQALQTTKQAASSDASQSSVSEAGGSQDFQGGTSEKKEEGASSAGSGASDGSQAANSSTANSASTQESQGSSASSGSNAVSQGGAESSSGDSSPEAAAPANTVTVSVSVSSSAVGNPVSGSATPTFNQGATVYDALCACGLSVNASQTQYGIYVSAIGGLAEKEHGGTSGWMYSVNGNVPMTAASNYVLSDGDVVSWYYVTG